jgi:hypothetical protein
MLYKVLYLPLGEEILISVYYTEPYIPSGVRGNVGLKTPGTPTNGYKFKRALFSDKETAISWIKELIERGTSRDLGLRFEHFEIVDINRD